jgi:hypothetical protein
MMNEGENMTELLTIEQRVEIAIRVSRLMYDADHYYHQWAVDWLSGLDRSATAAVKVAKGAPGAGAYAANAAVAYVAYTAYGAYDARRASDYVADAAAKAVANADAAIADVAIARARRRGY